MSTFESLETSPSAVGMRALTAPTLSSCDLLGGRYRIGHLPPNDAAGRAPARRKIHDDYPLHL